MAEWAAADRGESEQEELARLREIERAARELATKLRALDDDLGLNVDVEDELHAVEEALSASS